jgi:hypothetical protein
LPKLQFWLAAVGSVALVIGAIMIVNNGGVAVAAIGSSAALAAALLMAWLFITRAN